MHVAIVAGARPNFVKVAALFRELRNRPNIRYTFINTGQHYDENLADTFFRDLELPEPHYSLNVGSGSHAQQTARVMERIEPILEGKKPDVLIVVGDVNSTVGAALAGAKLGIKVAHVEAGLRSRDWAMPEEINRLATDAISDILFASEDSAVENLISEGRRYQTHLVGNVMVDTLKAMLPKALECAKPVEKPYAVLTLHRLSNVDNPETLRGIISAVEAISERIRVFFPVHPRTTVVLEAACTKGGFFPNLRVSDPVPYLDNLALLSRATFVMTDSGGIQEETTVLGVPCLTLRFNTERPVTCTHGTNKVIGNKCERIIYEAERILDWMGRPLTRTVPFWDGKAAVRIFDQLETILY